MPSLSFVSKIQSKLVCSVSNLITGKGDTMTITFNTVRIEEIEKTEPVRNLQPDIAKNIKIIYNMTPRRSFGQLRELWENDFNGLWVDEELY
jgi:hypothetical protein